MCDYELFQRRFNIVEIDVGDEAIDACIDTGGLLAMHIRSSWHKRGERRQIRESPGHGGIRVVAANPLIVVSLRVELPGLAENLGRQARVLAQKCIAEASPVTLVLPARIRHD